MPNKQDYRCMNFKFKPFFWSKNTNLKLRNWLTNKWLTERWNLKKELKKIFVQNCKFCRNPMMIMIQNALYFKLCVWQNLKLKVNPIFDLQIFVPMCTFTFILKNYWVLHQSYLNETGVNFINILRTNFSYKFFDKAKM